VRHRHLQVPLGLKPLCFFVLNGTTKVVPSQLERKSCAAWRPQVPLGLKPLCLFVLNGTTKVVPSHRSESCAPALETASTAGAEAPLFIRP